MLLSAVMGVGHINTTGFFFGYDDEKAGSQHESVISLDVYSCSEYLSDGGAPDIAPCHVLEMCTASKDRGK